MYLNKALKKFKKLRIQNNLIESIEDDDFGEIGFSENFIWDCEKIVNIYKPIDWLAFGETK